MTVINGEGQTLWIAEQLDLPAGVVEAALDLEFEYMVGVGIVDIPDYEFEIYSREELGGASDVVDIDRLASDAEERLGIMREIAAPIFEKETEFLEMRGLID
jgi:hypothetical protein